MKGRVVALEVLADGREAAALMVDGRLEDLRIDAPADRGAAVPGAIFRALADRPIKGMGGMMLRLPGGESGFLREARGLAAGEPVLVQVSTASEAGKAPPVTRRLMFKSRYAIVTPGAPGVNVSRAIRDPQARARLEALAAEVLGGAEAAAGTDPDAAAATGLGMSPETGSENGAGPGKGARDAARAEAGAGMGTGAGADGDAGGGDEARAGQALGLILRTACDGVAEDAIAADIDQMRARAEAVLAARGDRSPALLQPAEGAHLLAWRDWVDPDPDLVDPEAGSFERHGVWEALARLLSARVTLEAGASMWIEPTRALVAVDVNTGADTSPAAGLKANIAALRALPRELSLRGLGGQIVIDMAPYPRRERQALEQALRRALKQDGVETTLAGWTPLGHLELQRKRDRYPLSEVLKDVLPDL